MAWGYIKFAKSRGEHLITDKNLELQLQPKPKQLQAARSEIKYFCEEAYLQNPKYPIFTFQQTTRPDDIYQEAKNSSLGDILLPEGGSLSMSGDVELDIFVGITPVVRADLRIRLHDHVNSRFRRSEWSRELNVRFYYQNNQGHCNTYEELSTRITKTTEHIDRLIFAGQYNNTGYEGHSFAGRQAVTADLLAVAAISRQILSSA